jgi:hypothetical protein
VGCGGGGANCGGEKPGCPDEEGPPSHGEAAGSQPGSGSSDGKSAVGHCSAVTSVPQSAQNRTDSSGRGCPHDGHQRATVPPKSAPPGRLHAVPGPGIAAGVTGHLGPASIPAPGDHSPPEQDLHLEQELNGVLDDQQRICNRRRVSHPAISTRSRPPRTWVSGSGLPAAAPAPRDARLAAVAGARAAGPKRRTSPRIYGPAGCPDGILRTACPPPKLRPTQSAPGFKPNQAGASDITEIICLVTVTCDGNGSAAARPAMIPHRRPR